MDTIELFYQHVRMNQMLHFFINAQAKEFEFIPFIDKNTLVQNSFHANIYIKSEKTLKHILQDMCPPSKKRKRDPCATTKIENLEKYSVYLFKLRKETIPDIPKNNKDEPIYQPSLSANGKPGDIPSNVIGVEQMLSQSEKKVAIEDIYHSIGTEKNKEEKSFYIENLLNSIIKRNFFIQFELEDPRIAKQKTLLDKNIKDLKYKLFATLGSSDQKLAPKKMEEFLTEIIENTNEEFKNNNLDITEFKKRFTDAFINYIYVKK